MAEHQTDAASHPSSADALIADPRIASEIAALSKVRTRDLTLSPQLHQAYLEHTWRSRRKINAGWMLWAAALNGICCLLAFDIVPQDAQPEAIGGRFGISVVLIAGALAVLSLRRTGAEGLITIAVALSIVGLMGFMAAHVGPVLAERYVVQATFLCGTAIILSRIPWGETVVLTFVVLLALGALMVTPPTAQLSVAEKLQTSAFFGVGLIGLAMAKRAMKKLLYRVFVLSLLDRMKMADIEHMNRRLNAIARTDALTAVSNRRGFDEALAALKGAPDDKRPTALMMIDIDFFKRLNDTRGHAAGDDCLRQVADVIRGELRNSNDLLARFGGEEFVAILPDVDGRQALSIGERIRAAVEARAIANPGADRGVLTVSIGAAVSPPVAVDALVARADAALYEAKSGGRNAVRLAPAPAVLRVA